MCDKGTATCRCYLGFQGAACEQCAPGYRAAGGTCVLEILARGKCWTSPGCGEGFEFDGDAGTKSKTSPVAIIAGTAGALIAFTALMTVIVVCIMKRRRQKARLSATLTPALQVPEALPARAPAMPR